MDLSRGAWRSEDADAQKLLCLSQFQPEALTTFADAAVSIQIMIRESGGGYRQPGRSSGTTYLIDLEAFLDHKARNPCGLVVHLHLYLAAGVVDGALDSRVWFKFPFVLALLRCSKSAEIPDLPLLENIGMRQMAFGLKFSTKCRVNLSCLTRREVGVFI